MSTHEKVGMMIETSGNSAHLLNHRDKAVVEGFLKLLTQRTFRNSSYWGVRYSPPPREFVQKNFSLFRRQSWRCVNFAHGQNLKVRLLHPCLSLQQVWTLC